MLNLSVSKGGVNVNTLVESRYNTAIQHGLTLTSKMANVAYLSIWNS